MILDDNYIVDHQLLLMMIVDLDDLGHKWHHSLRKVQIVGTDFQEVLEKQAARVAFE